MAITCASLSKFIVNVLQYGVYDPVAYEGFKKISLNQLMMTLLG